MREKLIQSDIDKIKEELDYRKGELMDKALEDVKVARAHGDLSENFEYKAAKQFLNRNKSRIRYLEKVLENAIIIEDKSADDEVGINNTVTVFIPSKGISNTVKLVTEIRGDSLNQMISIDSPFGKAVLGHKVGDIVTIKVNEKISYEAEITAIDKNTDDSNDKLREF